MIPTTSQHRSPRRPPGSRPAWRRASRWLPTLGLLFATVLLAVPSAPTPPLEQTLTPAAGQRPGLNTIVIDPGHGGQAVGALGPGGISEKALTLDIAERLQQVIVQRLGLNVILTRQADVDVPHEERTEKANYWQADLFLSIHANGYRLGSVRGPETYFLSATASDAMARAAAESENAGAESTGSTMPAAPTQDLEFILWDLAQTQHLRESSLLAEIIQSNMNELWQVRDRGVKQAPFLVLKGATMPAVLVEVGYLSNDDDAARLSDPAFRQRIAETLYRSITAFRERYAVLVGAVPDP